MVGYYKIIWNFYDIWVDNLLIKLKKIYTKKTCRFLVYINIITDIRLFIEWAMVEAITFLFVFKYIIDRNAPIIIYIIVDMPISWNIPNNNDDIITKIILFLIIVPIEYLNTISSGNGAAITIDRIGNSFIFFKELTNNSWLFISTSVVVNIVDIIKIVVI